MLQSTIDSYVASGYCSGIVALVGHGDDATVFTAGDVKRDSIFRIASDTKPIVAVATMLLVADGALKLADNVDRWLPELANRRVLRHIDSELSDAVPAHRPITVDDLLTFRCGFGLIAAAPDRYPIQRAIADAKLMGFSAPDHNNPHDFDAFMRLLGSLPLMAQPGEQWLYSAAYNVLGVLIERVADMPFADFLQERIFEPLGMVDTSFWVPGEKLGRLTSQHTRENGQMKILDDAASSVLVKRPRFPAGDAGLVSTVDDMFALARMFLHDGTPILPASAINDMMTDHLTRAQRLGGAFILLPGRGWGYGGAVVREPTPEGMPAGTFGWGGTYGTSWWLNPATRTAAISFCTMQWESAEPPQLHKDVQRLVFAA